MIWWNWLVWKPSGQTGRQHNPRRLGSKAGLTHTVHLLPFPGHDQLCHVLGHADAQNLLTWKILDLELHLVMISMARLKHTPAKNHKWVRIMSRKRPVFKIICEWAGSCCIPKIGICLSLWCPESCTSVWMVTARVYQIVCNSHPACGSPSSKKFHLSSFPNGGAAMQECQQPDDGQKINAKKEEIFFFSLRVIQQPGTFPTHAKK